MRLFTEATTVYLNLRSSISLYKASYQPVCFRLNICTKFVWCLLVTAYLQMIDEHVWQTLQSTEGKYIIMGCDSFFIG